VVIRSALNLDCIFANPEYKDAPVMMVCTWLLSRDEVGTYKKCGGVILAFFSVPRQKTEVQFWIRVGALFLDLPALRRLVRACLLARFSAVLSGSTYPKEAGGDCRA
jgi:hypothetical protein